MWSWVSATFISIKVFFYIYTRKVLRCSQTFYCTLQIGLGKLTKEFIFHRKNFCTSCLRFLFFASFSYFDVVMGVDYRETKKGCDEDAGDSNRAATAGGGAETAAPRKTTPPTQAPPARLFVTQPALHAQINTGSTHKVFIASPCLFYSVLSLSPCKFLILISF